MTTPNLVLGKDHIDLLVTAAIGLAPIETPTPPETVAFANEIGDELWAEVYHSTAHRLGRKMHHPEYVWEPVPEYMDESKELDPWICIQVLAAVRTYEYQASESPDWATSRPKWLMGQLRESMAQCLEPINWPKDAHGEWTGQDQVAREWTREVGFKSEQ